MNNIDWQYLRKAIIILLLTTVIAVMMSIVGNRYQAAQQKKYESSVSTLRATHGRYRNLVNDIDILEQYRALFIGYKSTGLVGEERRLSWIESLESTNKVLRLPRLTYSLKPQEEFARPGLPAEQGVILKSAAMVLSMGLLHEEDLFSVFEGLRLSIKNLFAVDSCILTRGSRIDQPLDSRKANLTATCVIQWVTINAK